MLAPNEVLSSVGDFISRQVAELIVINSVCVVGPTQQRYTLTHRVTTATTRITIRVIPRHGKSKNSDYSLLATSDVYITCMAPRNQTACVGSYKRSYQTQITLPGKQHLSRH